MVPTKRARASKANKQIPYHALKLQYDQMTGSVVMVKGSEVVMRLIDADKLIEQMKLQAGCAECDSYHGILCKSCQWDDAIDLVDDFADNHPYFDEDRVI